MTTLAAKPDTDASGRLFSVFASAWAGYALIHCLVTYLGWFRMSHPIEVTQQAMVIVSALIVLGRPSSVPRLMLLCTAMLILKLWDAPFWPNHIFHTLLINLMLMGICLFRLMHRPAGQDWHAAVGQTFAPVGRLCLMALYFWVVVHKLNWDYLNPQVSCGWVLYTEVVEFMQTMFGIPIPQQDWMQYPCLLGALIIEALIPLLLLWRPTRKAGLLLGLVFHYSLTFHRNEYISSFSLMMYAHYTLFLSDSARQAIINWWLSTGLGRRAAGGRGLLMPVVGLSALLGYGGIIALIGIARDGVSYKAVMDVFHLVSPYASFFIWLSWAGLAMMLFLRFVARSKYQANDEGYYRPGPAVLLVLPLLCFLNGFAPYVGLKTHNAYAMFSNLRTEAGVNNHLFLPTSLRVVDYQDDVVVVIASNQPDIKPSNPGERMTWFDFRRRLMKSPEDVAITYQRGSEPVKTLNKQSIREDPSLAPPPWIARVTLNYKLVPPDDEPCQCRH